MFLCYYQWNKIVNELYLKTFLIQQKSNFTPKPCSIDDFRSHFGAIHNKAMIQDTKLSQACSRLEVKLAGETCSECSVHRLWQFYAEHLTIKCLTESCSKGWRASSVGAALAGQARKSSLHPWDTCKELGVVVHNCNPSAGRQEDSWSASLAKSLNSRFSERFGSTNKWPSKTLNGNVRPYLHTHAYVFAYIWTYPHTWVWSCTCIQESCIFYRYITFLVAGAMCRSKDTRGRRRRYRTQWASPSSLRLLWSILVFYVLLAGSWNVNLQVVFVLFPLCCLFYLPGSKFPATTVRGSWMDLLVWQQPCG